MKKLLFITLLGIIVLGCESKSGHLVKQQTTLELLQLRIIVLEQKDSLYNIIIDAHKRKDSITDPVFLDYISGKLKYVK